jgi:hypothetical protein
MAFIRTKIVNGKTYRSLEERYREGKKVKSRYVRALNPNEFNRSVDGYSQENEHRAQGAAALAAREQEAEAAKFSQADFLATTAAPTTAPDTTSSDVAAAGDESVGNGDNSEASDAGSNDGNGGGTGGK